MKFTKAVWARHILPLAVLTFAAISLVQGQPTIAEDSSSSPSHAGKPCELIILAMGKFGGREMNYHGLRAPYYTRTENPLVNMKPELRDLYQVVFTALAPSFDQASKQTPHESGIRL